jgi:1-deoxy-D-xylulose-5-phosphate reductoisomerase
VLNAANEVVVAAFLDRRATFNAIPRVVEETLSRSVQREADTLDTILDEDAAAREIATALVG